MGLNYDYNTKAKNERSYCLERRNVLVDSGFDNDNQNYNHYSL